MRSYLDELKKCDNRVGGNILALMVMNIFSLLRCKINIKYITFLII